MLEDQDLQPNEEVAVTPELPEIENLVGFFDLLITVDRRINPERYD
ncbi:MAG: hypothetical protein ABH846_01540 [Patescibacteria group bacterium]